MLDRLWGPSIFGICALFYLNRSAIRCAKSSVVIMEDIYAQLTEGVHLPQVYVHCLYIYRSSMRCAKLGVAVFKASILD